jgi:hypothetical protein
MLEGVPRLPGETGPGRINAKPEES